jgi:DNA-binding LacI/PurR family transcriptional regulator
VRVRLKDVALRAGVSVKTVSNVVNGYEHVTDRTRSRVKQALDELGYRPNLSARSLRTGRTGLIAIAVPRLDQPYFAELAGCVVRAAERHGLTVLIDQTDGLPDRERLVVSGIRPHSIDGLIFSPLALGEADLRAADLATPLVLLGERIFDGGADHVAIDNVARRGSRDEAPHRSRPPQDRCDRRPRLRVRPDCTPAPRGLPRGPQRVWDGRGPPAHRGR